jgi:hypothetical protein
MDFTGRGSQPAQPASTGPQFTGGGASAANNNKKAKPGKHSKLVRWGAGVLGLLVVVLVVGVILLIGVGGQKSESTYVDDKKLQAIFLQTGQVYFGNVTKMNSKYFVLSNIYYLQTSNAANSTADANSTAANTNVSLVKLGCELHAPVDEMVINRDQVTFWENLNDSGQVAKAVATFQKENPNGQKCEDPSAANNQGGTVQSQSQTNTGTGTTNTNN